MKNILINISAVAIGLVVGSVVNMTIVEYSSSLVPLPEGVIPGDMKSLQENIHRFSVMNFVPVFLAHALGTLVGAVIACVIARTHQLKLALGIGGFFLLGGISMVVMLPTPIWYILVDLIGAYIPMGYLGWKLAGAKR